MKTKLKKIKLGSAKHFGYHLSSDYPNQYQPITPDDYVRCAICNKLSGYVWKFDSATDGTYIQVCGECAYLIDGKKRLMEHREKHGL